ncbi:MAG: helix-turn-helix domain-containing protein [Paludibacteraceae bacterium]|nr:helix-turn-helix domain-containing protein [Paludibacteraceae bacterium]
MGAFFHVLTLSLVIIMLAASVALWRLAIAYRRLLERNREIYNLILREQHREVHNAKRTVRTVMQRSSARQLFLRLSDLMSKQQPYTDAELNRETLANLLGTNHRYIDEAIRACSNCHSTNAFINSYRVDHAARLLSETDEPIALIAEMSGFANRTSFNDKFRERFKMTPSEFRRAARKQ